MLETKKLGGWMRIGAIIALIVIVSAMMIGCKGAPGETGPTGPAGSPAPTTGTLTGKVTNSLTGKPVSGATIATVPAVQGQTITTNDSGVYSATLPVGAYTLNISKTGFTAGTDATTLAAGLTVTKDFVLQPTSAVIVSAGTAQTAKPGTTVTLKATATPLNDSSIQSYEWSQVSGVSIALTSNTTDTLSVTLPAESVYKDQIVKGLELLNRVEVKAINPHALSAAEIATFKVTVTTSSGKYSANVNVTAELPYEFTTGLANVPKGAPVLLSGKDQASYDWVITSPQGSTANLDDATSRTPVFIPDMSGKYTVTEKTSNISLDIYAGTWAGAITGQDAAGNPIAAGCSTCHNGTVAPDKFTEWAKSGHAEIFTQNINNPAGHWTESCAVCHTVGDEPNVQNNGWDEAAASEGWKAPSHGEVGLYTEMLSTNPKTTMLANIQCENCHGPNNESTLHANGTIDPARVSLSADLCGSCHGEPPRHGRFQQWEESGHGNYELAIDESGSSNCARCHTAQGFLTWLDQGNLTKPIQGANGNATAAEMQQIVTKDTALPQTCVVCHDPHNPGSTSGEPNNATVRIIGDTLLLPAGFKAEIVGKGAICITCHNTRNNVHNVNAPPTSFQAPHSAAQGDVLMGENAYFVPLSVRSPHALVENTCVTCHLNESPPPADYSLAGAGTNHGFTASIEICGECHSETLNGEALQNNIESKLAQLATQMSTYLLNKMPASVTVQDYTPHTYNNVTYDVRSDAVAIAKDNIASMEPTEPHGQQGYLIKLKSPVSVTYKPTDGNTHTLSISQLEVQLGNITTDGTKTVVQATDNLVQAGWNYFLIHGDGSEGVHNPGFAADVINASIDALK